MAIVALFLVLFALMIGGVLISVYWDEIPHP